MNFQPHTVACGELHTLVATAHGDVFSWGSNESGQCGIGPNLKQVFAPACVNFDAYAKPKFSKVSAGAHHSGFLDEIGRLFMCGKND